MKTYIDRKKIGMRAELSNTASIGGLVLLLASVLLAVLIFYEVSGSRCSCQKPPISPSR